MQDLVASVVGSRDRAKGLYPMMDKLCQIAWTHVTPSVLTSRECRGHKIPIRAEKPLSVASHFVPLEHASPGVFWYWYRSQVDCHQLDPESRDLVLREILSTKDP
jgi:hypothetical protein